MLSCVDSVIAEQYEYICTKTLFRTSTYGEE
jgi:hypothetical protein